MPIVTVNDASFFYGAQNIFKDICFSVEKGEIFCLIGPNGCGKTTLLDCILGFQQLHSGNIHVMGKNAKSFKPGYMARSIAYVPQSHERTFPYTVQEIVTMGRAAHLNLFETPSETDRHMADEALERIGISHLGNRPYTQLSGGEAQLVMIARALTQQTQVIIMDEPTAHLDFHYELIIMEVITELVKKSHLSIIMATHFPNHAFYFQNKNIKTSIALLHKGGFLAKGGPEAVLDEERLKILYNVNASVITLNTENSDVMKFIVPLSTV